MKKIRIRAIDFKPINIVFLLDGRRKKIACTSCGRMGMALHYKDVANVVTHCCNTVVDLDAESLIHLLPLKK